MGVFSGDCLWMSLTSTHIEKDVVRTMIVENGSNSNNDVSFISLILASGKHCLKRPQTSRACSSSEVRC